MTVHGNNLLQKESASRKYHDETSLRLLAEIRPRYEQWKADNAALAGPFKDPADSDIELIQQRVNLFEGYKAFIDQQKYAEAFDSRSNLHSSVLEEFLYYLFRDLVASLSPGAIIGKSHAFKDMFFMPGSYSEMLHVPAVKFELKDHDFIIGTRVRVTLQTEGSDRAQEVLLEIPAVAIECKTYIDKTMLEGSSAAAEQLKYKVPNSMYMVVSEWIKLTENINLRKYKVDQIYVLRKQKNVDREFRFLPTYAKNPVYADVVQHLYDTVRAHLTSDWSGGVRDILLKGYIE
jgi:hypothetical protein